MQKSVNLLRLRPVCLSVLAALTVISPLASSAELITNGDFESGTGGNATAWTVTTSSGSAVMGRSNAALSPCCGIVPVTPISGYSMMTNQTSSSGSAAYQIISIPQNARSLTFSASLIGNFSTTVNDVTRIDILSSSANPLTGTALKTLYVRVGTDGNQPLTTLTTPVTGLNGQTVMLRLYTYAYSSPNNFAFDNISLSAITTSVLGSSQSYSNSPAYNAARVIDANSNLQDAFGSLSSDKQVSNAATQTLPLLTGAGAQATQNTLNSINGIIYNRIQSGRGQASGDSFTGDKNVWMKPFGSIADQDARNGVAGYKANTYGMILGADAGVSSSLRLGAAFAYAKSDVNGTSEVAPQSAKVDVYQLIGYGSYSLDDRTAINFQADAGQNMNRGRRQLDFISKTATSHYQSDSAHLGVSLDRGYRVSEKTVLTPSIRADYTWIRDRAYSEAGAGLLNLNVDARTTEALVVGIDGRVAHQITENTTLLGNIGIGYDALGKQASTTAAFAGASNSAFVTYGIDPDPWSVRAGVGVAYKVKENLEITGRYDAEHRESFLNQTASVKARWAF